MKSLYSSFVAMAAIAMPVCSADSAVSRRATISRIVGYLPTTDVSDELMLDLDQYNIEEQLIERKVNTAKLVYQTGGHSQSFALLNMTGLAGSYAFEAGASVWAHNENGMQIKGTLMDSIAWDDTANTTFAIKVMYDKDQGYDHCQVGALYLSSQALLTNCFKASGSLQLAKPGFSHSDAVTFPYSYNTRAGNKNGRTIQQLALQAQYMRTPSGDYYDDFQLFKDYYGQADYADRWIIAAADKAETNFGSGLGNANFAELVGRYGQGEAMMKGTVFLALYMYTIVRLEHSLESCNIGCRTDECKRSASNGLDETVAFYAGSLADNTDDASSGVFFYALADNRAHNFKTAGHKLDEDSGTSYVNLHALTLFKDMQKLLLVGDTASCATAAEHKDEIIRLMRIPLIQSVLGYAYIRDREELRDEDEIEKTEAKGATYVASILPYIQHCSGNKNAEFLYNQMRVNSEREKVDYKQIKRVIESSYDCLRLTCAEVGGIWNGKEYASDASPCGIDDGSNAGGAIFKTFVFLICCGLVAFLFIRYRRNRYQSGSSRNIFNRNQKQLNFEQNQNIAAVSEIA